MADVSGYVLVPAERLKALEELEAKTKAKNAADFARLKEKYWDSDLHAKKMLEKYHANKEEINAKRREAYRLKKEAAAKAAEPTA
jgi:uncharacterized protein YktA (UPF0223 family)